MVSDLIGRDDQQAYYLNKLNLTIHISDWMLLLPLNELVHRCFGSKFFKMNLSGCYNSWSAPGCYR